MDIKNITGLEKPLTKLVETVAEALGIVGNHLFQFDVAKIKRIGKAKAEAEKQKIVAVAEGQGQAIQILGRAGKRFALEQYNKQINLENIIVKTRDDLQGKAVSAEPVEKDWAFRFMGVAQNISKDELQTIIAKILSGEIQRPGSFSLKTLETIKNLSKKDLERFQKFVALADSNDCIFMLGKSLLTEFILDKYDISYNDFLIVSEAGLVSASNSAKIFSFKKDEKLLFNIGSTHITKTTTKESDKLSISALLFTLVGREIAPLVEGKNNKKDEYIKDLETYLNSIL